MYVYIHIYVDIQHTFSPKNKKLKKNDEFDFSIMCSGTQNRFKSNPSTQI